MATATRTENLALADALKTLMEQNNALLARITALEAQKSAPKTRPAATPKVEKPMVEVKVLDKISSQVWSDFRQFGVVVENGKPKYEIGPRGFRRGVQDPTFAWWDGRCRSFAHTATDLLSTHEGMKLSDAVAAKYGDKAPNVLKGLRNVASILIDHKVNVKA